MPIYGLEFIRGWHQYDGMCDFLQITTVALTLSITIICDLCTFGKVYYTVKVFVQVAAQKDAA